MKHNFKYFHEPLTNLPDVGHPDSMADDLNDIRSCIAAAEKSGHDIKKTIWVMLLGLILGIAGITLSIALWLKGTLDFSTMMIFTVNSVITGGALFAVVLLLILVVTVIYRSSMYYISTNVLLDCIKSLHEEDPTMKSDDLINAGMRLARFKMLQEREYLKKHLNRVFKENIVDND